MGNKDNPAKGAMFEKVVQQHFAGKRIKLERPFILRVGVPGAKKRDHKFDLGSEKHGIVVECKAHTWTAGKNAPSAKMAVWNEAMFWFSVVPKEYQKVLFVQRSILNGQTLSKHYVNSYDHMIPTGVEIWECGLNGKNPRIVFPEAKHK